ncbi:hypothetical protein ABT168_03885 [Streptomyces sp. NPDC001793]|uniref:hypothetical protein n=1 Tax=Streptomyces sp. NPDC001793 TaxID=3154657 RepID=UPI003323D6DB
MRLLPRSRRKQASRPGTEATPSRPRELITFHVHCDREAENKVRALCVLALSRPGARVEAMHTGPYDAFTTNVQMLVTLDGPQTGLLDRLVDMLSGVPSVRDLHWHRHDEPAALAYATQRRLSGACAH